MNRNTGAAHDEARDTVLFLSCWSTMGGAQVSLAIALEALHGTIRTVLVAPAEGPLVDRVRERACVDEHVCIPPFLDTTRAKARLGAAWALLRWLAHNHRRLAAVHANGDAELKLLLPVLVVIRAPVAAWYHSREMSPTTLRLRPLWRLLGRRIRWASVSGAAREQLGLAGIKSGCVAIVPNPIDPLDVLLTHSHDPRGGAITFGYLGCEHEAKGILLLPDIADDLRGKPVRILCVTKNYPRERNTPEVNDALDRLRTNPAVEFAARDFDVRKIYERVDALLVPSLSESFCRIAAEAMLIGLPVVASDLPAVREVTGDSAAALLFPPGDHAEAASCMLRIARDRTLRMTLAERGHALAQAFDPKIVAVKLTNLYGIAQGGPW